MSATLNLAHALVEALRLDEAAQAAAEAGRLARGLRHARHEAHAVWTEREVAYRRGLAGEPRLDLVEAATALGSQFEGDFALVEAAVAWRAGHPAAADLARRARDACTRQDRPLVALLAGALAAAASGTTDGLDVPAVVAEAEACAVPDLGVQILGLLARATGESDPADRARGVAARGRPASQWAARLDVLSYDEAMQHIPVRG